MKLGNILARQGGTPLTGHRVRFQLLSRNSDGQQTIEQVEVMLFPVDTKIQADAAAEAREFAFDLDDKGNRANPNVDPDVETTWRFLLRTMRDPEAPSQAWATVKDLARLKSGLVQEQVLYLRQQYQHMLRLNYPELCSEEELRQMRCEANDAFSSGQS